MRYIKNKKTLNLIIIISIILFIGIYFYQYLDYRKQVKIINEGNVDYVYIESVDVKRIVKKGLSSTYLDQGYICLTKHSSNVLLSGHALEQVFLKLNNVEIGDIVTLYLDEKTTYYEVVSSKIIYKDEFNIFDYDNKLILVTCDYNRNKRLIIVTKKLT